MKEKTYTARQWTEDDGPEWMIGLWGVFDNDGESIFGDRMPRDKLEAEQCARAANLAYMETRDMVNDHLNDLGIKLAWGKRFF